MVDEKEEKEINNDDGHLGLPFIWCLVGNIIEERYFGEGKEIKRGTKKFTPGTKVYCFPALWGDGYEEIKVIGGTKKRKNYSIIITSGLSRSLCKLFKRVSPRGGIFELLA